MPLTASVSAPEAILTVAACNPPNTANNTPSPHVQKLLRKFITPERSRTRDNAPVTEKAIIIFTHGSIAPSDSICVTAMENAAEDEEAAAADGLPPELISSPIVALTEAINVLNFAR